MIKRFDEEKPVEWRGYDVFGKNGDYLGYFEYMETPIVGWYKYEENIFQFAEGTYYSDDHDDWLRMIEGLIEIQNKYARK